MHKMAFECSECFKKKPYECLLVIIGAVLLITAGLTVCCIAVIWKIKRHRKRSRIIIQTFSGKTSSKYCTDLLQSQ